MEQKPIKRGPQVNATYRQMTVRVPPEVHRGLKIRAAETGESISLIMERLARQYLAKGGQS